MAVTETFRGYRRLTEAIFYGPFVEIPDSFTATVYLTNVGQGTTIILGGLQPQVDVATANLCFFEAEGNTTTTTTTIENETFPFTYGKEYLSMDQVWVKGDTREFDIHVETKDNDDTQDVDLTGGLLTMTAKWRWSDIDANAVFQVKSSSSTANGFITVTNATSGEARVKINPPATIGLPDYKVQLYYDIQFVDSSANVYTVVRGNLIILPHATIATS